MTIHLRAPQVPEGDGPHIPAEDVHDSAQQQAPDASTHEPQLFHSQALCRRREFSLCFLSLFFPLQYFQPQLQIQ
jgi:hypothetical protein